MLNETALRKPEFKADVQVTLADGQQWSLPLPGVAMYPTFDEEGNVTVNMAVTGMGDKYEALCAQFRDASVDTYDRWLVRFQAIAILLAQNYTIENKDLREILSFKLDDPESRSRWNTLDQVMLGINPNSAS